MDWRNNKSVQFAVGCTLLFLLVRWLLTGDLLLVAAAATQKPADGETSSIVSVIWPMVFEAVAWIGASAIAWAIGLWDKLQALLAGKSSQSATSGPLEVNDAARELLRAAAMADVDAMDVAARSIRLPYLQSEMQAAIGSGDKAKASKLFSEWQSMVKEAAK